MRRSFRYNRIFSKQKQVSDLTSFDQSFQVHGRLWRHSGSKKLKGQWFLISAIMATGVFLVISGLFKTYLVQDTSPEARANEDYFFDNIRMQFNEIRKDCPEIDRNLRDFRAFVSREMTSHGYLFYMNYSLSGCTVSNPSLLIASERYVICQNLDAKAIVPQLDVSCAQA